MISSWRSRQCKTRTVCRILKKPTSKIINYFSSPFSLQNYNIVQNEQRMRCARKKETLQVLERGDRVEVSEATWPATRKRTHLIDLNDTTQWIQRWLTPSRKPFACRGHLSTSPIETLRSSKHGSNLSRKSYYRPSKSSRSDITARRMALICTCAFAIAIMFFRV